MSEETSALLSRATNLHEQLVLLHHLGLSGGLSSEDYEMLRSYIGRSA